MSRDKYEFIVRLEQRPQRLQQPAQDIVEIDDTQREICTARFFTPMRKSLSDDTL